MKNDKDNGNNENVLLNKQLSYDNNIDDVNIFDETIRNTNFSIKTNINFLKTKTY